MIAAYLTAAESDVILSAYADWLALSTAVKDDHLSWGRVWIDSTYVCPYDDTDATDDLKHANAIVGYVNSQDKLFSTQPSVKSTSVGAGPVTSAKTYASGYKADSAESRLMRQAKLLLGYDCESTNETGSVGLSRN